MLCGPDPPPLLTVCYILFRILCATQTSLGYLLLFTCKVCPDKPPPALPVALWHGAADAPPACAVSVTLHKKLNFVKDRVTSILVEPCAAPHTAPQPPPFLVGTRTGCVRRVGWDGAVGPRLPMDIASSSSASVKPALANESTCSLAAATASTHESDDGRRAIVALSASRELDVLVALRADGSVCVCRLAPCLAQVRLVYASFCAAFEW